MRTEPADGHRRFFPTIPAAVNPDRPPPGNLYGGGANVAKITTDARFLDTAIDLVADYTDKHLDKTDDVPEYKVFVVWYCKTLQNFKALLSTTLFDGMYYEVTYNGDKDEIYLDAYKKFENVRHLVTE